MFFADKTKSFYLYTEWAEIHDTERE